MKGMKNFIVGMISTMGVNQSLLARQTVTNISDNANSVINTLISIIGGILSTVVVAYLQHRWRMIEDERKFKRQQIHSKKAQHED